MLRGVIAGLVLATMAALLSHAAVAQSGWGGPWDYYDTPSRRGPSYPPPSSGYPPWWGWDDDDGPGRPAGPSFRSGGARPEIAPIAPARVAFPSSYSVGSIVIDHRGRQLFLVQSPTEALRYPISVGREGFSWTGSETISRIVNWPDWHPPEDMRERDPNLPEHMSGGLRNPLGAKALYLGKTLYRIHGTNDAKSIGRAASSGCFRMLNGHVIDLASRVGVGTVVTVVKRLPPELERTVAEQVRDSATRAPAARAPSPREPAEFDDPDQDDDDGPDGYGPGGYGPGGPGRRPS